MPVCTVKNTTRERVELKLNGRTFVHANPGETVEVQLTGDQVGYLRGKGLEVKNPEEKAKPPKDSKIARLLADDPDYAGPLTGEDRGATALSVAATTKGA